MRTSLITGASSGIGEAFARRLARDGHDLVIVARSGEKLEALADELSKAHSVKIHPIAADLTARDAPGHVFQQTSSAGVHVDWLINNAGFGSMGDFADLERERELEMIELNVRALVALTHLYLGPMRQRRAGTIINVSSAAGFQPVPFMATYAATKSFVTAFSEAIGEENRPYGIQVLALCPGSTKTNFFENAKMERAFTLKGQETPEQVVETAMRAVASGRSKIVSGWTNWLVATSANIMPNTLITRIVAKGLRDRYQKDE